MSIDFFVESNLATFPDCRFYLLASVCAPQLSETPLASTRDDHAPGSVPSSARAGAREASCADFEVGVWGFNPKPE